MGHDAGHRGIEHRTVEQGPETELAKLFAARGIPGCQQCRDLATKMDAWGVDECPKRVKEIVNEILPRARAWADKGLVTWLAPNVALKAGIRKDVLKALENAQ